MIGQLEDAGLVPLKGGPNTPPKKSLGDCHVNRRNTKEHY